MAEPLIINNFQDGIAESPHLGFGLMRNVNIEEQPGAAKVNVEPETLFHTAYSSTLTSVAATDVSTADETLPLTGTAVKATTTGTLPAGLTANTVYIINSITVSTFYFYDNITNAEAGGATGRINITDTGTGTHTVTTVNPGTVNHIIRDPRAGNRFLQDSNGRVWFGSASPLRLLVKSVLDNAVVGSAPLPNAAGNGIVLYKQNDSASTHYLLAFRNALIDIANVYGDTETNAPSWTNGWDFGGTASDSTLNSGAGSGNRHHAIVGQDDIVYFTDGRFVGSIKQASGSTFDPATTSTYTGNDQALDTPTSEVLVHLEELGVNLLAASSTSNKIYPWDRVSDSFTLPLIVPEKNVHRMKNIGNTVYILAGSKGNIYTTTGSIVRFFKKIPEQMTNNGGTLTGSIVTWGGIEAVNGALLVGLTGQTAANRGVYIIYPDGRVVMDEVPTPAGNVTALHVENNLYWLGHTGGADWLGNGNRYANFQAVIQSGLKRVATKTAKATYSVLEVLVGKLITAATSSQVRIGYRTDSNSSFTTIATFSFESSGDVLQKSDGIGLIDIENIEIQAEMHGLVELVEIRLLP